MLGFYGASGNAMYKTKKFVIIDGNALIHRAFHALPPLTTKDGKLVNAVYGFTTIFLRVLKELKPEYVAVTFDKKAPTFRHEEYKDYKATRVKQPDELYEQIPIIKDLVAAFRVPIFEKDGFEADDLIGTISHQKKLQDLKTIIVTGDLDALQLVDDNTEIYTMKRGITDTIVYDEKAVREKYDGLGPDQMIDLKALKGDASDNIPGVKGIGEKGGIGLIKTFGSLENIYQSLKKNDAKSKKISERNKKLLLEHKADAFMSKKLATIVTNVPVKFNLEKCKLGDYSRQKVVVILQELGFKSLLNKLPENSVQGKINLFQQQSSDTKGKTADKNHFYQLVDDNKKFDEFLKALKKEKVFALDTETSGLNPIQAELIGISFAWEKGKAYFVLAKAGFLKKLKPILEDPKIKKYGHNIKYDLEIIQKEGITLHGIAFDTMVASYLLNPGSRQHNLDSVVFAELGHEMIPIKALIGEKGKNQITMNQVPVEKVSYYSCEDADYTSRLVKPLARQLEEKVNLGLLEKIEVPLIPVLAEIETNGVKVDPKFLNNMSKNFAKEIQDIERKIYKLAGREFNISSPLQLKEILFEKLKISTDDIKKIKTGFSTAAGELEKMRGEHPIIDLVSRYREYTKLKSTYLDALPKLISPKTGRVHTSFNQTITATGRLSSSNPNLQNIPIRTKIGREIRKAFVAEPGHELVSIDYSQIELRIVASLANDQKMIEIFKADEDIHRSTAAEINGVSLNQVTKEMRYAAKEVNFGVLYGMGAYGLAWRTRIKREKAQEFIDRYFSAFKGVEKYIEQTKALAQSLGYVETLFGRRRYLPEINSGVAQIRNAAERMAINMPIQGTAADLMKLAMIEAQRELGKMKENKTGKIARMILQVHDELVFEIRKDEVQAVSQKIKEIMENVYKLKVPVKAEVKTGKNWGEMRLL